MINQAINTVCQEYNVIGIIDLDVFFQPGGENKLYTQLQNLYLPVYQPNDRIVVIQSRDTYDYDNRPGKAITVFQKFLQQLDISNWFILLLTTNKNAVEELEQTRSLYSTDSVAISCQIISGNYTNVTSTTDTFCILPWVHLYIGPNGNVQPCCVADQSLPLGNIVNSPLEDIIHNEKFAQIRQNMRLGKRSPECENCYRKEDLGLPSPRAFHNMRWKDSVTDQYNPVYLDIRLNNICNLKCRMCSGYFSSAIAQEEIELFGNHAYKKNSIAPFDRPKIISDLLPYLKGVEKIYFAGGEPLLAAEHYTLLDALIECGNTKLEIFYNTNFTNTNFKSKSIFDYWKNFKDVTIGASIDAYGSVAEYIRHGTVWSDIEKNLSTLKKECPHVKFTVTSTVGFMNVRSLIELQKRWHTCNILPIQSFSLSAMTTPLHLIVCSLPGYHKELLANEINAHIDWCKNNDALLVATKWQNVLSYMMSQDTSHYLSEFRRLTNLLDQHRGESFADVLPEYKDLL